MMARVLPAFALVVLVGWCIAPARALAPASADEVQDLIFLADDGPVLIRLHLLVDGVPFRQAYRAAWRDYVTHLFRQLDHHGDGKLTEDVAALLPPAQPMAQPGKPGAMAVHTAFNFRVVDTDGDGKVSLTELLEYYEHVAGSALQTQIGHGLVAKGPSIGQALFARLDTNHDGKLSHAELQAAAALMDLDRDEDELLSARELMPQATVSAQPAPPRQRIQRNAPVPSTSFLVPSADDDVARVVARLRERYRDDKLGGPYPAKLREWPADVELIVRLGQLAAGEKRANIVRAPERCVRPSADDTLCLMFGKVLVEIRLNDGRPAMPEGTRERFLAHFHAADRGTKGYLTPADAREYDFFPNQFALLDRDGDGKLTEAELLAYFDEVHTRQARAVTSAVALATSDEGNGLFDLLDRNRDGLLSLRELRAAPALLTLLGREQEGALSADELPRSYRVAVGLCEASFDRFGGRGAFSPRGMPLLTLDWSPPGLAWFHKMDRNHDGDLSRHEFLGSREAFDRLDTDQDGLISLEEARHAARKGNDER